MDKTEFSFVRKKLGKTQLQMAQLLRTSDKAVQSYEQGWRRIPAHIERQLLFLLLLMKVGAKNRKTCWTIKKCPPENRKHCPAWEFKGGAFCFFINGTICEGEVQPNWEKKMEICRSCEVMDVLY